MEKQEITLMEQLIILSRLMMYRHHHMKGNHMHSPYRGQGRVLSLLKIEPKMSQKKLSFLLGIRPQSMGELLGKLEQNGDITRTQSEEDRRSLDIELTEKGMEAATANENFLKCDQNTEEIFKCLNEEEQKNLADYMDRMITLLKNEMPEAQDALLQHHMHHHHDDDHHENHENHGHHMKGCMHNPKRF